MRQKVLVVDDEPQLLRALNTVLSQRDYEVVSVTSGEEAIEYAASHELDAVILDLQLPGVSGLEVCRVIREYSEVPILILSVRDGEADKIAALDLGADDYLTKPFSSGELLARVRAMLRRRPRDAIVTSVLTVGDLTLDLEARTVLVVDRQVRLTRLEFEILAELARNPDRVITTHSLLNAVWGQHHEDNTRALRVHVSHLRAKIDDPSAPKRLLTEPGVGYRLSSDS